MSSEDEPVESIPIEMFEGRNKTQCKFCGCTAYWIFDLEKNKWLLYDIATRTPHPRCVDRSNLRIYKYR